MENRMYKVDLYLYDRPLIINPIEFYQNDTESCAIEFNFNTDRVNKFDLTNKTVEIRVTKPDLTTITDSATITGLNTAVWELKLGAISVSGSYSISIYVYQNTERLTFGTLKYKVIADREIGNVSSQPEYPILTNLIGEVQAAVNESNQTNENISVMEQQRVTNEQLRQQNEITRNSDFNNIKSEYAGIKGIMIDTNNAANLQNQVNQVNTQLAEKAKHIYPTMTTSEIQTILTNYREVLFTDGTFNVNPLNIASNTIIYMSPNTILKANTGYTPYNCLLNIVAVNNVVIYGNHASIQLLKSEYTIGESRHGVLIFNSTNVTIYDLHSDDSGGDGFYIGGNTVSTNLKGYSENITLMNCYADNNRRQGLSITSGRNVNVIGGKYANTIGTAPAFGIDVETNDNTGYLDNINLINVITEGNDGGGIAIVPWHLTKPVSITVKNCFSNLDGKDGGLYICNNPETGGGYLGKFLGSIVVEDMVINKPQCSGVNLFRLNEYSSVVKLRNIQVIDVAYNETLSNTQTYLRVGFLYRVQSAETGQYFGNVDIIDCSVIDTRETPRTYIPFLLFNETSNIPFKNINIVNPKFNVWTYNTPTPIMVLSPSINNVNVNYDSNFILSDLNTRTLSMHYIGSKLVNGNTNSSVQYTLPLASTVIGSEYTFRVGVAGYISLAPNASDGILHLSNGAGSAIISRQIGSYIKIKAVASGWQVVEMTGTWTVLGFYENRLPIMRANAAPTTGTWQIDDMVYNNTPTETGTAGSKYLILAWKCVVAGTPGTWLPLRCLTGN